MGEMVGLPLPAGGVELSPEDVERWLVHSAINNADSWELPPMLMNRRWKRWDDAAAADPGLANPFPNSATLFRPMTDQNVEDMTNRLTEFYDAGPGGPWMIWSPWATPDLTNFGFHLMGHPPLMVRVPGDTDRASPDGLVIREVEDAETLEDWINAFVEGYEVPELRDSERVVFDSRVLGGAYRLWVGYVDGRPITCAAALSDGRAVGVTAVATVAEARGRGYGAAITRRAATCSPELPSFLNASDLGRPVYEGLGFVTIARYTLWFKQRGSRQTLDK